MSVQFEEERPFSTTGLPAEKPKGLVKFLMNERLASSPRVANIELIIIAIIIFAGTIALFIYRDQIINGKVEVKYNITKDPMINMVHYRQP